MSWLDKTINALSPRWGVSRFIYRERLKLLREMYGETRKANIEATGGDRNQYDLLDSTLDIDSVTKDSLESLRNRVRDLELNDGSIAGPIKNLTNHIVGTGFTFQSKVTADKKYLRMFDMPRIDKPMADNFNFWMEKRWKTFCKQADIRLRQNYNESLWLKQAAILRDGEVLVVGRKSKNKNRMIPYCQEILEIDRLLTPSTLITDPQVRNGIRYDADGVPQTYYVLKYHPGSTNIANWNIEDYEEIPAFFPNGTRKVLHLFRMIRPEQIRGFTELISALPEIQNVTRYKKAEMFAALEDACMTGIVKTTAPANWQSNYTKSGDDTNKRIHEFSPGKWHYLNQFEEATIRDPKRPNDKFDEIVKAFYRGPANAINTPPEFFLQDWHDINYSNARTIIIELYVGIRMQQQYLIDHDCSVTQENVLHDLVATGQINAPGFMERKEDYLESTWIPPRREWVDPENEAKAKMIEIQMGVETPSSICAAKGVDFDENLETMAKNLAKKKELEKEYDVELPPLFSSKSPTLGQEKPEKKKKKNLRIKTKNQ